MDDDRKALKAIIWAGSLIIIAGIAFVFLQLFVDVYVAIAKDALARGGQAGAYTVGLAILMIGAALIVTAVVATRPRPAIVESSGDDKDKAVRSNEEVKCVSAPPHAETEVSLTVKAGTSPKSRDEPGDG